MFSSVFVCFLVFFFFFFKQKTAYEMRISDWSSDVCSSDLGLPVPPGFTITTDVCTAYYANGEQFPAGLSEEVAAGIAHIEGITGKTFGDAADPLLVSVRSGARVSMPGMMDTVLNQIGRAHV